MVQKSREDGGVQTATNLDGSFFGQSFPQVFLNHSDNMIEQPPKVFLYEPKIRGFRIAGSRGSKYFKPSNMSLYQKPQSLETCFDKMKKPEESKKEDNHQNTGKRNVQ